MRHLLANVFTYALIAFLVVGCLLWAWARDAQLVIAREADLEPRPAVTYEHPADFDWQSFGERTYKAGCENCHTADGSGRGMYPPIQRMAAHLGAPGGREYLVDLLLHGVYTGTYGVPMPPMPELSDAEIAAVTNYMLTRFAAQDQPVDEARLYLPREVADRRGRSFTEWEIGDRRPAVPTARELGRGVKIAIDPEDEAVPDGKDD